MALRDALEQAFGVFISTNTKISNDDIISGNYNIHWLEKFLK